MDETKEPALDAEIMYLEELLVATPIQDEEYEKTLQALERLRKLKENEDKAKLEAERLKADMYIHEDRKKFELRSTLINGALGIVSLVGVLGYEHFYPVLSKAAGTVIGGAIKGIFRR